MIQTKAGLPWVRGDKKPRAKFDELFSTPCPISPAMIWPLKALWWNPQPLGKMEWKSWRYNNIISLSITEIYGSIKGREEGGIRCSRLEYGFSVWVSFARKMSLVWWEEMDVSSILRPSQTFNNLKWLNYWPPKWPNKKWTHKAEASHEVFSCCVNGAVVIHLEFPNGLSHYLQILNLWCCFEDCMH